MDEKEIAGVLGGVADGHPVYVALMTLARMHGDGHTTVAMTPGIDSRDREFYAGAAWAMRSWVDGVEQVRSQKSEVGIGK